jgi:hypothetical protein
MDDIFIVSLDVLEISTFVLTFIENCIVNLQTRNLVEVANRWYLFGLSICT